MENDTENEVTTSDLQQQMLKHALAFATGVQYSKNPDLLQQHQAIRFDQLPPDRFDQDDPGKEVAGLLVSYEDNNSCPQRGHYYTPTNNQV